LNNIIKTAAENKKQHFAGPYILGLVVLYAFMLVKAKIMMDSKRLKSKQLITVPNDFYLYVLIDYLWISDVAHN